MRWQTQLQPNATGRLEDGEGGLEEKQKMFGFKKDEGNEQVCGSQPPTLQENENFRANNETMPYYFQISRACCCCWLLVAVDVVVCCCG